MLVRKHSAFETEYVEFKNDVTETIHDVDATINNIDDDKNYIKLGKPRMLSIDQVLQICMIHERNSKTRSRVADLEDKLSYQ